ncbi:MAG: formate/nitrite transporter family protein [Acutalibacteraceae bacterium]
MKTVFSGIAAGFAVALGGAVYLSCDNKYVGAVLFAVALLAICYLGFALFTGKAGFIVASYTKKDISELLLCLPGNLIGAFLGAKAFAAASPAALEKAMTACSARLLQTMPQAFFKALLCGVLMYIAVAVFRKKNSPLGVIFCIPVFILSGFEHSIADMFYFSLSGIVSLDAFIYIWIIILGNFVGSAAIAFLDKIKD